MDFDLVNTLYKLPGIIIGLTFHEFAHAQTAIWFGDDTPRLQGRNSLNPLVHLDIIGFMMLIIARFGWAKPVQVNPSRFRNPKRDDILVSLAGPAMNLLLAIIFLILIKVSVFTLRGILDINTLNILLTIFVSAIRINIILCIFNLLPIPPLDGSHIFFGLTGQMYSNFYNQLSRYSMIILVLLIVTDLLNKIIGPPIILIYNFLVSFI